MTVEPSTLPCITFLNGSGDVTITWTPENEEAVIEMVRQKLKDGYSFFVIKPRLLCFGSKRVPLTTVEQLRQNVKGLVVPDEVVRDAIEATSSRINETGVADNEVTRALESGVVVSARQLTREEPENATYTRDAALIARSQTVAVRPIVGG